jgi:hypothetical protein
MIVLALTGEAMLLESRIDEAASCPPAPRATGRRGALSMPTDANIRLGSISKRSLLIGSFGHSRHGYGSAETRPTDAISS